MARTKKGLRKTPFFFFASPQVFTDADEPSGRMGSHSGVLWSLFGPIFAVGRSNQAGLAPAPTTKPTDQNTTETPTTAPTVPNSIGITTLDALIAINLRPKASPCRASGVI
jgi:hypothetical protein